MRKISCNFWLIICFFVCILCIHERSFELRNTDGIILDFFLPNKQESIQGDNNPKVPGSNVSEDEDKEQDAKDETLTELSIVLAEYEERIAFLETNTDKNAIELQQLMQVVDSLKAALLEFLTPEVPNGVKNSATDVVNKALRHEDNRILRFLISSDAHQNNGNELITNGTKELGQAYGEILKLIGVDFIANLGDVAWGGKNDSVDDVISQIQMYKQLTGENIKGESQLWCEGNHDDANYSLQNDPNTPKLTSTTMYGYFYSENTAVTYDPEHYMDGYCYKDFVNQKVRVICLNTEQGDGEGYFMEGYQLKWFAETALDMTGKSDWSVITMAHHPLDYGMASLFKDAVNIVDAFVEGREFSYITTDGTKISIDYTKASCQYVAHFHGHTHAFSVVRMEKYMGMNEGKAIYNSINAWQIGIPNACFTRNNHNLNNTNPRIARFSTPITYNKENVDGKRTSFNLVTICLDEKKIYLDTYGVGIDRVVCYDSQSFE